MIRFLLFVALILTVTSFKPQDPETDQVINAAVFKNPPAQYRSAPFYSLNDELDTAEVIRQIKGFKEGGYGGCFLHSRGGLLTEYMGKEWWKVMDASVRISKELGLNAWFYDEDKWPSGFAGGKVPLMSEDFHARCLTRIGKNEKPDKSDEVIFEDEHYQYICHKARMGNAWFNGTAYTDLLNPAMVKAFIDSAYAPYLERYAKVMSKTVPGIFTDEPQISARVSGGKEGSVSFSPVVVKKFKVMHGYDLLPAIPSLFDTIGNFRKIRYDYYQTISRCFEESFAGQIGSYCQSKNAIFTGHFNGEETFNTTMVNSGNQMINYRHMQMPGMDQLGLSYRTLNTPKSVSSVANQYGISRRLSEAYGISGQNMNFEDRKWLMDWHTINGINFIVPHLALYSMKGERKRDYPPNFGPAQPYWSSNKLFEDYTARLCYAGTVGKYAPEIVVIHPLESEYLGVKNNANQQYERCINSIQSDHRDFDLGDEQIISEIAVIKDQKFSIGEMDYKVVVLPGMFVIRSSTLRLLKKFSDAGGTILVYGNYPAYVDGIKADEEIAMLKKISIHVEENTFKEELYKILPADYTVEGKNSELVWSHYRKTDHGGILQLSNTSRLKELDCRISFSPSVTNPVIWNPENGNSMKLVPGNDGKIDLHFDATKTWLVTFGKASTEAKLTGVYQMPQPKSEMMKLAGSWKGKRIDPNALTLDFASYSIDGGNTFSSSEPVIGIHQRLLNKRYNGKLILKYKTEVTDVPSRCSLVLEQPKLYKITVNGKEINFEGKRFYRDMAFRVENISGKLKQGTNEILLTLNYVAPKPSSLNARERYGTEIESIYLTGDFAVNTILSDLPLKSSLKYISGTLPEKPVHLIKSFTITKEKTTFDSDLINQGYPFYCGTFILSNSFKLNTVKKDKKYFISFPSFEAIVLKIKVNGIAFDPLLYSPWERDISKAVREGDNTIEVTLINSLRNLLGPHHHSGGELNAVGPASFTGRPEWPNSGGEINWFDLRLEGKATLWRDDYCLVPFGLLKQPVILETVE